MKFEYQNATEWRDAKARRHRSKGLAVDIEIIGLHIDDPQEPNQCGPEVWTDSNGQYHREDGPAILYYSSNGYGEYWLNGIQFFIENYMKFLALTETEKLYFYMKWKG